ncbi:hypothetical protein KP003_14295 [Geomonas nitrogeniifigens]|uniref:YfaP family protein n=1 Tax=Geomonas diazotrophica TaxID=2843197 RepID=UPI001C2CC43E|nr:hypothetical protein [Geomonas nitrogeniifigens]QXE85547.1 hypothetical protein KP003_14295 [Geomonas nitrogeniifigens]
MQILVRAIQIAAVLITVFASVISAPAVSSAAVSACAAANYSIIYINGIWTTDARPAALDLQRAVGTTHNGQTVKVSIAYNKTHGKTSDLADVFRQKLNEYPGVAAELLIKALTSGIGSGLPDALVEFARAYNIDKIRDAESIGYSDEDLRDIVGFIRGSITENQKILLVPHSQGNLYANSAYAALTSGDDAIPTSSIKIFGIASPAAHIAGNSDYLTSTNDLVINGLRAASGLSVLQANFTVSLTTSDLSGHGMTEVYLNPDREGRAEIIARIKSALSSLIEPGGQGGQGPITVTLTWGAQPDVDLHVLEPDGNHVFYLNKQGTVGMLDLDITSSYGPEHYFTSCSTLQEGAYKIAVNYFNGSNPEVATVTITTPQGSVTRKVPLYAASGASGDSSPIMAGTVVVTRNPKGYYDFQVI